MKMNTILWRMDSSTEKQNETEMGNAQDIWCHPECLGDSTLKS